MTPTSFPSSYSCLELIFLQNSAISSRQCGLAGSLPSKVFFILPPSGVFFPHKAGVGWVKNTTGKREGMSENSPLLHLIQKCSQIAANDRRGLSLIMRRCCHRGKKRRSEEGSERKRGKQVGKEERDGVRWVNECTVVALAAYTNGLNCSQCPCFAQRCLYGVIDTHLYGWDVVSLSGNLNLYECESRGEDFLFRRPSLRRTEK